MRWFFPVCCFHAVIDFLTGGAMLIDLDATARAMHGGDVAVAMFDQLHPDARLLVRTS